MQLLKIARGEYILGDMQYYIVLIASTAKTQGMSFKIPSESQSYTAISCAIHGHLKIYVAKKVEHLFSLTENGKEAVIGIIELTKDDIKTVKDGYQFCVL